MVQDQNSIKVFERPHSRHRVVALKRPPHRPRARDIDPFAAYAAGERRERLINVALAVVPLAAVVLAGAGLLWK